MTPITRRTTDHGCIRRWAEERGGVPVCFAGPADDEATTLTLSIHFDELPANGLEASTITWEEFFERFEEARLAFLFREQAAAGGTSRFCLLVERG